VSGIGGPFSETVSRQKSYVGQHHPGILPPIGAARRA
jgi:hypothetical protein